MTDMETVANFKTCKRCKEFKSLEGFRQFFLKKNQTHYFYSYCKKCQNKITNERRVRIPRQHEKKKAQQLRYFYSHREEMNKARLARKKINPLT